MALDQHHHSTTKTFPAFLCASERFAADDTIAAFEDRLWDAAEEAIAAGAASINVVAEAASIVRRQSETYASILSGANYMRSLGEDAGPICNQSLSEDISNTENRLIFRLQKDMAAL